MWTIPRSAHEAHENGATRSLRIATSHVTPILLSGALVSDTNWTQLAS
jgi:hypothetical protein